MSRCNQPLFNGATEGLGAARNIQFLGDIGKVKLDGSLADMQAGGYFFIA